jgi:hypothetical protein
MDTEDCVIDDVVCCTGADEILPHRVPETT